MMERTRVLALAAAAVAGIGLAAPAQAETPMRIAHGYPAGSIVGNTYEHLAAYLTANSDIRPEVFPLTLLDLRQASPGLSSGVADVSMVLNPYFPNEFSETNFVADLTMMANIGEAPTSIGAVIAGAMMEYITMNCPDCVRQNAGQNQIYLATAPGGQFSLLCRTPVKSLADTRGKVLRSSTNNFRRWTEAVGATASSISGNEIFDGLSQGLIDCTVNAIGELSNFSLFEVVKGVTPGMPGGTFGGTSIGQLNLDYWSDLTAEQRQAVARGMADSAAFMVTQYVEQERRDLDTAREKGIEILEADPELVAATSAFVEADIATVQGIYKDSFALSDVETKTETFRSLIEKWKGLTKDLDPTDQQALSDLYWSEVLSKLDLETYGRG